MTDKPGGGDNNDDPPKPPERPDPFAPLPLANLPPVRRRGPLDPAQDAPTPVSKSRSKSKGTALPDAPTPTPTTPAASAPPDTRPAAPPASAPPDTRSRSTPSVPPDTRESIAGQMSWSDMPSPPQHSGGGSGGGAGVPPTETSGALSWTDMPNPSQPGLGAAGVPSNESSGVPSSESSGAMSWTDMPAASGFQPAGAGGAGLSPTESSGAMSWTDTSGPQMSGPQMSGPPDTRGAAVQMSGPQMSDAPDTRAADAAEGALLPSSYSENDLRAAVGATQRPDPAAGATTKTRRRAPTPVDDDDDDDDDGGGGGSGKPRNRKAMLVGALTLVVGGGIAAMVILGKVNSQRYQIACEADRVVVEQGRSFPPWGESSLDGAEWNALKIPPEAPCAPYETEDKAELAGHYLAILKDHATSLLTGREVTKVDEAEAQLKQALLVARSLGRDDDRIDARAEIERLLGDVVYWRASAKLRKAADTLTEAATEFDMASAQRPRHVTDAAAWALYVRKLADQLRAGPAGASQSTFPPLLPGERPSAPPGVALPIEPGAGSGSDVVEPVPPPAYAGLPTGGVLL